MPDHITAPHGEHMVTLIEPGDGTPASRVYEITERSSNSVRMTGEELTSLTRWWANETGARP